jgi:ferritin
MITIKQLKNWRGHVRQRYKNGKLSQRDIQLIESIPGWSWEINLEQEGIKRVDKICDFVNENGGDPSQKSKDPKERRLGQKLSALRKAKAGNGSWAFYPSYQKRAKERGYPELFEMRDYKQEGLKQIDKICDFIDKNNRSPSAAAKDLKERRLGQKLSVLKKNKAGRIKGAFYPSYQKRAKERGYPKLLLIIDREQEGLEQIDKICDFIDKNNRNPSAAAKDPKVKKLGQKLTDLKKNKAGRIKGAFYPSYQKRAKERGYPELFEIRDSEQEGLEQIDKICDFIDENGKTPKRKGLGNKLETFKRAKEGKYGHGVFYPSYQKRAKERGYPKLFERKR